MTDSMNQEINYSLNNFDAVSLADLDKVALQDRMDTKYVFSDSILPELLKRLSASYFILQINNSRAFEYNSLYYDTPSFDLYGRHACGKLNRYKIRIRKYVETDASFFEIKFKNNKGRTLKSRVDLRNGSFDEYASDLLNKNTPYALSDLKESLWVNYSRITLVNKEFTERVTIDTGLHYIYEGSLFPVHNIVIAELKQNKLCSSRFAMLMKEWHIRPSSLSKYCLGVASHIKGVKVNNFKPNIIQVNKIQHASAGY